MIQYLDILEEELEKRGIHRHVDSEALERRRNGHVFSKEEHLKGLIYALLSNQRPWKGIIPHFDEIDAIFYGYDYEKIKAKPGSYFEKRIRAIGCGNRSIMAQMDALHHNINLLEHIIEQYGSLDSFVTADSAYITVQKISNPASEYKISQLGPALAWEYLRNVGIDGAKPDLHMRRFFGNTMLSISNHEMASITEVLTEVENLHIITGRSRFEIDYIIWTAMSQGICNDPEIRNRLRFRSADTEPQNDNAGPPPCRYQYRFKTCSNDRY